MCGLVASLVFPTPELAYFFALFVGGPLFVTVAGILALPALKKKRWRDFSIYLISLVFAYISIDIAKSLFVIPRPEGALIELFSYRFPSGHATMAAALATAAFLLYRQHLSPRTQLLTIATGVLAVLLVGMVRILLVVHCPIDILAGALLGTAVVFAVFIGSAALADRRH